MAILTAHISGVAREALGTRAVRLALDGPVPLFEAGQYMRLGDRGQPVRKPYSIACSPLQAERSGHLEFLIQLVGDESPGAHLARLVVGRPVDVEGPSGSFMLPAGARPRSVVLVGGGTGIAPLRAMLWQLLEESAATRVALVHSARTPEGLSYSGELRQLADEGRIGLVETVTRDAPASWQGLRGRIGASMLAGLIDGADAWCFVCGPDSLVEGIPRLLAAMGVDGANIRTEHWADGPTAAE